ncbi:hypothetical protein [Amycolatopsis sp. YIM 10]|uniref:hypothetical protein n=1 Tax=Amycolatopsis sp. YIM 10 TaxID=2653857 RepID=UPI00128FDBE2|nr:hypothetical protein [Amycolatopsis sp. YIM 10]QFU86724.1 hypothetical protein YIM_07565 [Amycolatopsis sp. YIM 10]
MVTTQDEITRRLKERDAARSARRAQAATTVGELARRHTELAVQLADLERELGEVLTAAGDVIDVPELAQITDVPAADLTRWRDQAAKPSRGRRTRPSAKKNGSLGSGTRSGSEPRAARPVAPVPPEPEPVRAGGVAVGAASP